MLQEIGQRAADFDRAQDFECSKLRARSGSRLPACFFFQERSIKFDFFQIVIQSDSLKFTQRPAASSAVSAMYHDSPNNRSIDLGSVGSASFGIDL
jgi:hypothetical protein